VVVATKVEAVKAEIEIAAVVKTVVGEIIAAEVTTVEEEITVVVAEIIPVVNLLRAIFLDCFFLTNKALSKRKKLLKFAPYPKGSFSNFSLFSL